MDTYIYNGPVYRFGVCADSNWKAETWASSKDKAMNNLRYRYKKEAGLAASARVILKEEYLQKKGE